MSSTPSHDHPNLDATGWARQRGGLTEKENAARALIRSLKMRKTLRALGCAGECTFILIDAGEASSQGRSQQRWHPGAR
jgi:hypothetical protein